MIPIKCSDVEHGKELILGNYEIDDSGLGYITIKQFFPKARTEAEHVFCYDLSGWSTALFYKFCEYQIDKTGNKVVDFTEQFLDAQTELLDEMREELETKNKRSQAFNPKQTPN